MEVLARWIDPSGSIIRPDRFISVAESHGVLDEISISLLHSSIEACKDLPESVFLSFNITPSQLLNKDLAQIFASILADHEFDPRRVKIEITETAFIEDMQNAKALLDEFAGLGCAIVMDDFGTGYSSLTWLRSLPFETIKIDASFVHSMLKERESRKIISAVVGLGRSLNLSVVAEGIENHAEADMLRRMGCTLGQGYLFGRPAPAEEARAFFDQEAQIKSSAKLETMSIEQRAHQISALYRTTTTSIGFLDMNLTVVDASAEFARRFGKEMHEIIGQKITDFSDEARNVMPMLKKYREEGLPYPTFEFRRPDNRIDVVTLAFVRDEAEEPLGFCILGMEMPDAN